MKTDAIFGLIVIVYLIVAVACFGRSAATGSCHDYTNKDGKITWSATECSGGQAVLNGISAGIFWPLYLSWTLQEGK